MLEFLSGDTFKYGVFPLLSAALGVGLKYVTRNDQYAKLRKEDFAVGLELILTGCLMFVVVATERATKLLESNRELKELLDNSPPDPKAINALNAKTIDLAGDVAISGWVIVGMLLGLWGVSTLVRKRGWESDREMKLVAGIAAPLVLGVLTILVVMAGVSK